MRKFLTNSHRFIAISKTTNDKNDNSGADAQESKRQIFCDTLKRILRRRLREMLQGVRKCMQLRGKGKFLFVIT